MPVSGLTDDRVGWLDRALADESGQRFRDQADQRDSLEVLDWALDPIVTPNTVWC